MPSQLTEIRSTAVKSYHTTLQSQDKAADEIDNVENVDANSEKINYALRMEKVWKSDHKKEIDLYLNVIVMRDLLFSRKKNYLISKPK